MQIWDIHFLNFGISWLILHNLIAIINLILDNTHERNTIQRGTS